jgi:TIR domain-containing protein
MKEQARQALFISHASPEDNAFTLWLGAKLAALGYEVFADVLRLKGGDDWERILESAIRNKAAKFLLTATPHGVQKQGVRNEIAIATETAKRINDKAFIVPLRLAPFDAPLQIAHAQYIDFSKGWAPALSDLLTLLSEAAVPKSGDAANAAFWQGVQLKDARTVSATPERLVSNWLPIETLPERIIFYDFKGGISIGAAEKAVKDSPLPVVAFNRGFLSFAPLHQLQDHFGPNLPLERIVDRLTNDFLNEGWPDRHILPGDARAKFTDLVRQALDGFFQAKGLQPFEIASGRLAWWATAARATTKKLSFGWPEGLFGLRQIVGRSIKRGFHWHYGVSCWARTTPIRHIRVAGRVVFTFDGANPLGDARRLHRLRRSFCKSWRNAKWRDLLLTFWHWLGDGASVIDVLMGEGAVMKLRLPPLIFDANFGIDSVTDSVAAGEDDDDGAAPGDVVGEEGGDDEPEDLDDDP